MESLEGWRCSAGSTGQCSDCGLVCAWRILGRWLVQADVMAQQSLEQSWADATRRQAAALFTEPCPAHVSYPFVEISGCVVDTFFPLQTVWMPSTGFVNNCDGGRSHTYCDYRQQ